MSDNPLRTGVNYQIPGNPLGQGQPYFGPVNPMGGAPGIMQPRQYGMLPVPPAAAQTIQQSLYGAHGGVPVAMGPLPAPQEPRDAPMLYRVSTRIPYNKGQKVDPHEGSGLQINEDAARQSPEQYSKNAQMLAARDAEYNHQGWYPDLKVQKLRNDASIYRTAINHMADNLIYLHDHMVGRFGQDMVDQASRWYDGANRIAHGWAQQYGYNPENVAGGIANLSPQKDWYQNAGLAGRMLDILQNQRNTTTTLQMQNWMHGYFNEVQDEIHKDAAKGEDVSDRQDALNELRGRGNTLANRPFWQINDPDTRALWVRAYDEAHNPREYQTITPDGDFAELARNEDGTPRKIAWGSFGEIAKALRALEAGDMPAISKTLGGNHKVRSFFNNIIAPMFGDDVTVDTHAIAAAHMRPLSGNDDVVKQGLGTGGTGHAATGTKGTYWMYADAYREAARRISERREILGLPPLLPRQLQSIAWEGVRGLFRPQDKRDNDFWNENYEIWAAHRRGDIDANEARRQVIEHAGDISPPTWWNMGRNTPPPAPEMR